MPYGPEGADIKGDFLQGETRLRGNCERDDQDGGRNEQGRVLPGIENPRRGSAWIFSALSNSAPWTLTMPV